MAYAKVPLILVGVKSNIMWGKKERIAENVFEVPSYINEQMVSSLSNTRL